MDIDQDTFKAAVTAWKIEPTTGLLGDILSYSIDGHLREEIASLLREDKGVGRVATTTQAQFVSQLLGNEGDSPRQDLATNATLGICNPFIKHQVATLRQILRVSPNNPLALLDLAQFQLASGNTKRAERSLLTALSLSPNSRLILRTLARLYVHKREPDRAHSLISKHVRTKLDPWLMATEIALAEVANASSKFAKKGLAFTKERQASNVHLSELAGALGGTELAAGNVKRARELFRLALLAPNDNVVAQAITNQKMLGIELTDPAQSRIVESAHEAQTLLAWNSLDCSGAQKHSFAWHEEEPFSSRPLHFLTTIYGAQRDFKSAELLAKRGLIADPRDPALLANLAYVLAADGRLDQAEAALYRLAALQEAKFGGVALATAGLIAMQQQAWVAGDELYEMAMRVFRERREPILEAICCAYYARSAADTGHPRRDVILNRAESLYKSSPSADAAIVLQLLNPEVQKLAQVEGGRRLSQWIYDRKTDSLVQLHRLTEPGAPALIIKN